MTYHDAVLAIGAVLTLVVATLAAGSIARAGFPLPPATRRIGCIDGLRGYLALSVMIHHFVIWITVTRSSSEWGPPQVPLLNEMGAGGVALFFMTTGLVFYPRVVAGLWRTAWPAVLVGRLFRILPLVTASVAIVLLLILARGWHLVDRTFPGAAARWVSGWDEPPLLGYPDSARTNAWVLWSLWYEWLFYLLVLPACAAARDVTRRWLPGWIVPVALLAGTHVATYLLRVPYPMLRYLPLFAIGMIAHEIQGREWLARLLRSWPASVVALMALGVAAARFAEPYGAKPSALLVVFFVCVACGNDLFGLLRTRGALVLGECSFGIYLLHGVLLSVFFVDLDWFIGQVATDRLPYFLPAIALAVVLVTPVTYLLVERPMIRRGARIAGWWTGRRVRATAQELEVAP